MSEDLCPEFGTANCMLCSGEACNLCGAGCWSNVKDCEHDVMERHQSAVTAITEGGCPRCQIAVAGEPVLHSYEWEPPDWAGLPTIFWNVAEIRVMMRLMKASELAVEEYPYSTNFIEFVTAHEMIWGHVQHIPDQQLRPSLVGHLMLPKDGELVKCSIMLDGHHSAMSRIMLRKPVELEVVPTEILMACGRFPGAL